VVAATSGRVIGWARVGPYDDAHDYYAGVGEATLYVDRAARHQGAGRALLGCVREHWGRFFDVPRSGADERPVLQDAAVLRRP
jgi:GNAT superfamily N-acetyltransferase